MMENPSIKAGNALREPSFLCTFCWKPQYPPSKPKALGVTSRIACKMCWSSILDLSICWVCGEIIVRGEEVVSLGWCFWHRGCFSCLICGYKLDPPTNNNEYKSSNGKPCCRSDGCGFRLREDDDLTFVDRCGLGETERPRGVELDIAPLCGWCETATAGCSQEEIYYHGDQNIYSSDGGLSRKRYTKWREHDYQEWRKRQRERSRRRRQKLGLRRKSKVLMTNENDVPCRDHDLGCKAVPLNNAEDLAVGEDGHMDGTSNRSSSNDSESSTPAPIYLSVMDAIGEPSFRASKTKPLPRWMTLQPDHWQQVSNETRCTSQSQAPTSSLILRPTDEEQQSKFNTILNTSASMVAISCPEKLGNAVDNVQCDARASSTLPSNALEEPDIGTTDHLSSLYYQEDRPRSGTPYPFEQAIYRHSLIAATPRYSRFGQSSTASTPDMSIPSNSLKLDFVISVPSNQKCSITDGSKRQHTKVAYLALGKETERKGDVCVIVKDEYMKRRDDLRKELLSLFNDRRQPGQEE